MCLTLAAQISFLGSKKVSSLFKRGELEKVIVLSIIKYLGYKNL